MAKAHTDESVQKLVDREVAKAIKATKKQMSDSIKEVLTENKAHEDKALRAHGSSVIKNIQTLLKGE